VKDDLAMGELSIHRTNYLIEQNLLTQDLFSRWIAFIDASPKTVEAYTKGIKYFGEYLSICGIRQPTRETVIAYRDELKKNHKPTTVQSYLEAVKLFFQWTEQERLYPNIAAHIKGAKLDSEYKRDYLTTKQVSKLLDAIDTSTLKGLRDYAVLSLMVTTGLRTISIVRADIGDIRTAGDSVALYYQGKGHEEKADYVKIAEPVEDAIRKYLVLRGETDSSAPLFSSISNRNSGGRMTTRSISRVAKNHLIEIDLKSDRLTAHSLRHTAATLNLLNGGTVEETKQLLGHANINTTLIYSHALERAKNDSENRIAKAIFG
jgi:integrase/recombinase XerD